MPKPFDSFTNLYALSKTLRFELKPQLETDHWLEENQVFRKDLEVEQKYQQIKPLFDHLHRLFVSQALSEAVLDVQPYADIYADYRAIQAKTLPKGDLQARQIRQKQLDELQKALQLQALELRKQIVAYFNQQGLRWYEKYTQANGKAWLKSKDWKVLTDNEILQVMLQMQDEPLFADSHNREVIQFFIQKKFFTYFTTFNQNRENFYTDKDKATAIAYRIVDENLPRFLDNCLTYQSKLIDLPLSQDQQAIFAVGYYNQCLLQPGIDAYNRILGGEPPEGQDKPNGINQLVNLTNQKHKTKLPQLKVLYKQILGDRDKQVSFVSIDRDTALEQLRVFAGVLATKVLQAEKLFVLMRQHSSEVDFLSGVYLSKSALNTISARWFNSWEVLGNILVRQKTIKKDSKTGEFRLPDFVSLEELRQAFLEIDNYESLFKDQYDLSGHTNGFEAFLEVLNLEWLGCLSEYDRLVRALPQVYALETFDKQAMVELEASAGGDLVKMPIGLPNLVKLLADSGLGIHQFVKYFALEKGRKRVETLPGNPEFYGLLEMFVQDNPIVEYYNAWRNFLTQKPFATDKFKLNFDNATLLSGWDVNKEADNFGVLLKREGKYFLALMNKKSNRFFSRKHNPGLYVVSDAALAYAKIDYKYLPSPVKMLPKVFFSQKGLTTFKPSPEVQQIYKQKSYKPTSDQDLGYLPKLHVLIDFYKQSIAAHQDWSGFPFEFEVTTNYTDLNQFYTDIQKNSYYLREVLVDDNQLRQAVAKGEVYLFQIYSKDFSPQSIGQFKDLQTEYLIRVLDPATGNLLKLNGEAEIFYRPATLDLPKNQVITKTMKHNLSLSKPDLHHLKRYANPKISFHFPVTINFAATDKSHGQFNKLFNQTLSKNPQTIVIGVDRGEKHLAYYSVVDAQGRILDDGSLNQPLVGGPDYNQILTEVAQNRAEARKNWETIGKIQNIKDGYISQVVRKLADLMLHYQAVVVFEDLNVGFKRGRQKIEKQVYQKLELALVKKLNYLTNKQTVAGEPGHYLSAYQLTPLVQNFGEIGKQCGAVLYVNPSFTSQTDPVTGFRKTVNFRYENLEQALSLVDSLSELYFDDNLFWLGFAGYKMCFGVDRYRYWPKRQFTKNLKSGENLVQTTGSGVVIHYDLNQKMKDLCLSYGLNLQLDLKEQILQQDEGFLKEFLFILGLLVQLRNTDPVGVGDVSDFIQSPVYAAELGGCFDSRKAAAMEYDLRLPTSGDANGAYNIAKKGLMLLERIRQNPDKPDLFVSNEDWDKWLQQGKSET